MDTNQRIGVAVNEPTVQKVLNRIYHLIMSKNYDIIPHSFSSIHIQERMYMYVDII